jgi:hypothetical protein
MAEDEDPKIISRIEKKKANSYDKSNDKNNDISTDYTKYAVGGESTEVPASIESHESSNYTNRKKQNQPK